MSLKTSEIFLSKF